MNSRWQEFRETMSRELGDDLARSFVCGLYRKSHGCEERAVAIYEEIGCAWSPLLRFWAEWVLVRAKFSPIALILRDGEPLAKVPATKSWKSVYLNRLICGISDEISKENAVLSPMLKLYLRQKGLNMPFTFVDSGCWGTIVRELHELGLSFQPLFFFSHNPHVPGFLNELGCEEAMGEILNDSLECCFPKCFHRPSTFREGQAGEIEVDLQLADSLSIKFGIASLTGVMKGSTRGVSAGDAVGALAELSSRTRAGEFTGILPDHSPTWSRGADFLAHWPKGLTWV